MSELALHPTELALRQPAAPARRTALADARTMAARCIRLSSRNLDALLTSR